MGLAARPLAPQRPGHQSPCACRCGRRPARRGRPLAIRSWRRAQHLHDAAQILLGKARWQAQGGAMDAQLNEPSRGRLCTWCIRLNRHGQEHWRTGQCLRPRGQPLANHVGVFSMAQSNRRDRCAWHEALRRHLGLELFAERAPLAHTDNACLGVRLLFCDRVHHLLHSGRDLHAVMSAWLEGYRRTLTIVGQIESLVGTSVAVEIESMIKSAWQHPYSGWASLLGAGTLLVGASSVFAILRNALNAIGKAGPAESLVGAFFRARLVGFALVLGFGFLSITSLLVSASLAAFRAYIFGFQPSLGGLLSAVDAIVSTVVLSVAFAALLRWLPGTAPSGKAVWIGASTSALLFLIGKFFIGVYLTRVDIASAYGAAGSFVVIMLWVYYSAQILLFGGALAAVLDERRIEVQIR